MCSLWDKCPKSKWKGFSPEHGVCSVSDGGDSAGVAASALCIQLGSLMHDGLKSRLDQSTLACVLNSKRRFSHSHAMHEAASRHELAVVADLERCARSKATLVRDPVNRSDLSRRMSNAHDMFVPISDS